MPFHRLTLFDRESMQLSQLTSAELAIIKNTELLAFSQDDTIGVPARPFAPYEGAPSTSPPEYYTGRSSKGVHVFVINIGDSASTKTFEFAIVDGLGNGNYVVHDMWTGKDLGTFSGNYSTSVDAHDTIAFYITSA
jgi:alpha-galactosidase